MNFKWEFICLMKVKMNLWNTDFIYSWTNLQSGFSFGFEVIVIKWRLWQTGQISPCSNLVFSWWKRIIQKTK